MKARLLKVVKDNVHGYNEPAISDYICRNPLVHACTSRHQALPTAASCSAPAGSLVYPELTSFLDCQMRLGSGDRLPAFKFSLYLTSFVIWNNTLNLSVLTFLSCKIT